MPTGRQAIIVTNYVSRDNPSTVASTCKLLTLCKGVFELICLFSTNFPPDSIKGLEKQEIKVKNLALSVSSTSSLIYKFIVFMYLQLIYIVKLVPVDKKSVVFFWQAGPMVFVFLFCRIRGLRTISYLYGNPNNNSIEWRKKASAWLIKVVAVNSSITCVESMSVVREWKIPLRYRDRIRVVSLYVDTNHFYPSVPYKERDFLLGMSCRLEHSKKPLEIIAAFDKIKDEYPQWKLEVAGEGSLLEECIELVRVKSLGDKVRFLRWVPNDQMPLIYNRWKLLLLPSTHEGLPNTVLESMACGTPVVASSVGGIPDVVIPDSTGWLLNDTDSGTMAAEIGKVISQSNLEEYSGRASSIIHDNYSFIKVKIRFANAIFYKI